MTEIKNQQKQKKNKTKQNKLANGRGAIPQDRATSREKGQPLCMAQYGRLFTSYRVPGLERDSQDSHRPLSIDADQHIIVAHRGQVTAFKEPMHAFRPISFYSLINKGFQRFSNSFS